MSIAYENRAAFRYPRRKTYELLRASQVIDFSYYLKEV
jgi:hypothetical protein